MGQEVVSSYLRSKLSSILEEAEGDSGSPSHIISRFRSIQRQIESTEASLIPVDLLYDLIEALSECRVFAYQRRTPHVSKKGFNLNKLYHPLSEFMFRRRIRKRLDTIDENLRDTSLGDSPPPAKLDIPLTHPIPDTSLIIGLDAEAETIEAWLMATASSEEEGGDALRAIGIEGRCGCGKTALAQKVFASSKVVQEFSPRIWVCLSEMLFDNDPWVKVVKFILGVIFPAEELDGSESSLVKLLEMLQQGLMGKKYLIVLDDAWRLPGDPHFLSQGLPKGSGGAVIVTSRRKDVISQMVGDEHVIRLEPDLSGEICWQILSTDIQQQGKMEDIHPKLSRIEDDVKRNFDGLPLVAKSFATVLPDLLESEFQEWADLGVEAKIVDSDAMSTLCNTFHRLTSELKMCSLCLSVFPENAPIKKRPLIYWWMGEGLVAKSGDATAEEVGERVFQELLQEGFIKPTTDTSSSFVVYPWIRRMLILLAQKAGFLKFTPNGTPCDGQRRAFLWRGNEGEKEDDVLTVFNIDSQYLGGGPKWLRRLQKVEVLQMGQWRDSTAHHIEAGHYKELFSGLGSQKHLKYLSLRGIVGIESLPESIAKLISLQILDLRACYNLEKLPRAIAELKNLTHLDVSECYLLETMPKGLEHLSSLQVVKGFVVGRNGCRIGDMARLRRLRKLGLRVRSNGNDQLGSLASFEALRILTISWGVRSSETTAVSVPLSLTKLDLRCVPFKTVPEWMEASKVPKLEKLYVTGGRLNTIINQEDYPGIYLRLKYLHPK